MKIFTIGFTQRNAENFFGEVIQSGSRQVIDVRLNNVSQLAGFSKRDDLKFFLKSLGGIDYIHLPILAPTKDILDEYKKNKGSWKIYEEKFMDLMESRKIETEISPDDIENSCLLCSEYEAHHCHRRLVAEYLNGKWDLEIDVRHL